MTNSPLRLRVVVAAHANKIALIKLVRNLSNLGLKEAKDLVETLTGSKDGQIDYPAEFVITITNPADKLPALLALLPNMTWERLFTSITIEPTTQEFTL